MTTYLVCEGTYDATLLKRLLPEALIVNVKIVEAGGFSSVKSLARSLIVRRQSPVAIVADADTVIPEQVEQRRRETEEIVGNVAINTPVKVILAAPTLEIIFFQDISLLMRLLGYIPSTEMLHLAAYQPTQVLRQLISQSENFQSQHQFVESLTANDLEVLRQAPVIQELIQFLQSVRETAPAL